MMQGEVLSHQRVIKGTFLLNIFRVFISERREKYVLLILPLRPSLVGGLSEKAREAFCPSCGTLDGTRAQECLNGER